jgi:hypothetical protein
LNNQLNRKERKGSKKRDDDYTGKYHPLARLFLRERERARKIFTTRVINPLPKPKETTTKWTLGPQFKQQGLQLE